jgi:hypothetical protein
MLWHLLHKSHMTISILVQNENKDSTLKRVYPMTAYLRVSVVFYTKLLLFSIMVRRLKVWSRSGDRTLFRCFDNTR